MEPFSPGAQWRHSSLVAGDVERLERDGYLIIEAALSDYETNKLAEELEPWLQRTPLCQGDFYGWRTTRLGGLLSKAPMTQRLALDARILAIAHALMSPSCDYVQLNLTQACRIHPGERAQAAHRDEEMWPGPKHGAHWLLNAMWAVSDFTPENGATHLWPGSHRQALSRDMDEAQSIRAVMKPGSVCLFLGSLTHGAGANLSSAPRTGVIVSYCLGWLKTYENQFLAYPKEVARCFPRQLQHLIGYRMHRPNLGGWEGRDPIAYLDGADAVGPHIDALGPHIEAELKRHYRRADQGEGDDGR